MDHAIRFTHHSISTIKFPGFQTRKISCPSSPLLTVNHRNGNTVLHLPHPRSPPLHQTFVVSKNRKGLPPSPPSLPFIGHLYLFKNPLHRALGRVADRYGSVLLLRFGSRLVLIVSSPTVAHECFKTNDITFANRPHLASSKYVNNGNGNLGLGSYDYGPYWRNLRRIATIDVLSNHRLLSSDVRAAEVRLLARQLFQKCKAGAEAFAKVELRSRLFELALNVIMMMIAGKRYYIDDVEASEEARQFREMVEETFMLAGATNLRDFLPVLRWFDYQMKKKLVRLEKARSEFIQRLIDGERKQCEEEGGERKKKTSMIADLLSLQKTDRESYADQTIKGLIMVSRHEKNLTLPIWAWIAI